MSSVVARMQMESSRDGRAGDAVDSITTSSACGGRWRSDLPTVLPIRAKRLDIFPRDIQKQITEAKKMGTLPDLSVIIAAQLGLASGEGPPAAVPRSGEALPSGARTAGKGKKRKRDDGGNANEQIEQEEEDARGEEIQPKKGLRGDSESPLLIRRGNNESDDERQSLSALPCERTPIPSEEGRQIGTSSGGSAILRRAPGFNFPDKVAFHYEDRLLKAARVKLLGDSTMNVVIDKSTTALKGALEELGGPKRVR
ncbi:hypothetical protein Bca101_097737 [Brassica carinata]